MRYDGYLYCLYNPMFKQYGDNIYKLGRTIDLEKRTNGYRTGYIEEPVYKYVSQRKFKDSRDAEAVLFYLLKDYRIVNKREFFNHNLDAIIDTFKQVEKFTDSELRDLASAIANKLCPERVFQEIDEGVYEQARADMDAFFNKFRFRPKNPENYYQYGYREPERINYVVLHEELKNNNIDTITNDISKLDISD